MGLTRSLSTISPPCARCYSGIADDRPRVKFLSFLGCQQMSTFIEDVRSRRVHPPTNQKFDPLVWSAAKNDKTTDDRDRQFAEAGLFFFSPLEEVRTRLPNTLNPFARSPMESLRLIIGFQNLDFRKMQN